MAIPPQQKGQTIYPISNTNGHNYTLGKAYVVSFVDEDGTFKGRDLESGMEGNWLKWTDVVLTPPLGWIWLKSHLPPRTVHILSLFQGIEEILLKEEHKDRLLQQLPDLLDRLEKAGEQLQDESRDDTLGAHKGEEVSILSFPGGGNGQDSPETPGEDPEQESDIGELSLEEMVTLLHEGEELSKNGNTTVSEGKDSEGNNISDDD